MVRLDKIEELAEAARLAILAGCDTETTVSEVVSALLTLTKRMVVVMGKDAVMVRPGLEQILLHCGDSGRVQ